MFGRIIVCACVACVFVAVVFASSPVAAQEISLSIGAPRRSVDRVSITVPVTASCAPFASELVHFSTFVSVNIQQAAGKQIARGTAAMNNFLPDLAVPCDGVEHVLDVGVLADPLGPPFHGGHVAVSAVFGVSAGVPCSPGATNCFFNVVGRNASAGPITAKLG